MRLNYSNKKKNKKKQTNKQSIDSSSFVPPRAPLGHLVVLYLENESTLRDNRDSHVLAERDAFWRVVYCMRQGIHAV